MTEMITGKIFLENNDGDSEREVAAPIGKLTRIEGTYGSLVVDAYVKDPPKIEGKGNVWLLNNDQQLVRSRRLATGETATVVISGDGKDFSKIGEIQF